MNAQPIPVEVPASTSSKESAGDPQKILSEFWDKFISKTPGKVTQIFPPSLYANLLPHYRRKAEAGTHKATASYEAAKAECERKVKRIVRECRRTNEKWSDPDFDIESDFSSDPQNCLHGLVDDDAADAPGLDVNVNDLRMALSTISAVPDLMPPLQDMSVKSLLGVLNNTRRWSMPVARAVHRVAYIYEQPAFTIDGFGTSDVQQGGNGDCWWVAAVATLCSVPGQMDRICVVQDEECGVYGFVFHRDGAWFPVVVDDNLYLSEPDYSADRYDPTGKEARKYKTRFQTGSEALCFAKCAHANEIWLPLLEKAYAKVHGDYAAIAGGFPGEGVEDMTGGVTTTIDTNKVLSKDRLWKELLNTNKEFIFATGTPSSSGGDSDFRSGLAYQHAYSVLEATEQADEKGNKVRLVRLRNPWGKRDYLGRGEWNGPWSDGSKEWTSYWLEKLKYKFDDDGVFWISFEDMLSRFDQLDRTRLFGDDWNVVQQWTSLNVSWITGYIDTKFVVEVTKPGPAVFVLSKLDERYFKGFEGQYLFELHFLLQQEGAEVGDHIARARPSSAGHWQRSVSAEVDLEEPGRYEVIPMIIATKVDDMDPVEEVVKDWAEKNPQKLRQIGLNYDIAHLKAAAPKSEGKKDEKPKDQQEMVAGESKKDDFKEEPAAESGVEKAPAEAAKEEALAEEQLAEASKEGPPANDPEAETVKKETSAEEASKEVTNEEVSADEEPKEAAKEEELEEAAKEEEPKESAKDEEPKESFKEEAPTEEPPREVAKETETAVTAQSLAEPSHASGGKPKAASGQPLGAGPAQAVMEVPEAADEEAEEKDVKKPEPKSGDDSEEAADANTSSWNAVCSVGLRVFSKDPSVIIKLVTPSTIEEGSTLDVGGNASGATM